MRFPQVLLHPAKILKQTNQQTYVPIFNASFGINVPATHMRFCQCVDSPQTELCKYSQRLCLMWSFSASHMALTHTVSKASLVAKSSRKSVHSGEQQPFNIEVFSDPSHGRFARGSGQALQPDCYRGEVFISGSSLRQQSLALASTFCRLSCRC